MEEWSHAEQSTSISRPPFIRRHFTVRFPLKTPKITHERGEAEIRLEAEMRGKHEQLLGYLGIFQGGSWLEQRIQ